MKQMQQQNARTAALALGLGLFLLAPAALAEVYAWRTEDGGYAYTDDKDHVPARYAKQVKTLGSQDLENYERFTPQDDAASRDYAAKLSQRLERLRAMNAPEMQAVAVSAPATATGTPNMLSLSTGNSHAPEIQVPTGNGLGPIVVEPVLAKQTGDFRTRRVTVIQQDGKTLAVIKGNPHHFNPLDDIYNEDELVEGAPLD